MEKVTAYKLSDGRIVEDVNEANIYERDLTFKKKLEELVEENVGFSDYQDTVSEFINEQAFELYELLGDKFKEDEN